jgi:hypothetical protein
MRESNIHNYAQHLISLMGPKAEAYAAQQAIRPDIKDDGPKAEDWMKIRLAVQSLRMSTSSYLAH